MISSSIILCYTYTLNNTRYAKYLEDKLATTNASKKMYLDQIHLLIDQNNVKDKIKLININNKQEQNSIQKVFQIEKETVKKANKLIEAKLDFHIESKKKSNTHIKNNFETNNTIDIDIECIIPEKQRISKSKSKKLIKISDLNTNNSKKISKIIVHNNGKKPKTDTKSKNIESSQNIVNSITPRNMLDIPAPSKLKIQIPVEDTEKKDLIKESNSPNSKVGKNGSIVIRKKQSKKNRIKIPIVEIQ